MNLNRKRAPGRLSRAIVTLATRTGNKLLRLSDNGAGAAAGASDLNLTVQQDEGQLRLSERTTITVETERLLIVRQERFSEGK